LKLKISLQKQICLYIIGFTLITTATLAYLLHKQLDTNIRQEINSRLLSNVAVAALNIDTDLHDTIRSRNDETGDSYLQIKNDLQKIRNAVKNIHYVYTMRESEFGEIIFVVDGEEKPEEIAHVNEIYDDASELLRTNFATMTHPMIEKDFYTDKWGTWITAYAPIYSRDGKRCGILGMDISMQSIDNENRKILIITLLVFIFTAIPFCFLGWYFGKKLTLPLIKLKRTLSKNFSDNKFDNLLTISSHNEIAELASNFNVIALKLKETINTLETENSIRKKTENKLEESYINTMEVIVKILDEHEHTTAAHSLRVPYASLILAGEVGITDTEQLRNIKYSALLHDIGKISISDTILRKATKLTKNEMDEIKKHPQVGYDIINTVSFLKDSANIILSHHEHYDGKGYPRGLAGTDICIEARIFGVIDAFDAIITDRYYRKTRAVEEAVKEINSCSGTQFDPIVVEAFNRCYIKFEEQNNKKL
jgi:putative nucleotidyltransferase with HDIG domain